MSLFRKMIQYCGKSMWISWVSSSFKGEFRVHLCRGVFSQCNDYHMSVCDLFYSKNRDLTKSCLWKWIMSRTKEITEDKKSWCYSLEKFTKPSLKSLDSTNPQSDRLYTNGGNSRPLYLPEKWSANKDHSKAERVIVCEVAEVPRVTSK